MKVAAATIRNFGWHIGLPYLRRFNPFGLARVEFTWHHFSGADLPARLEDGQECVFLHDLDAFSVALCDSLAQRKALLPWPYLRFRTMQAIVATTAGRTFYATVTKDLQKELARRAIAKSQDGH
ncbi:MAG: hypothetical protein MUD06_14425 [Rhodospirillales bacterium]|jgi:hypothetical protein|nr:hypothetical protein [Rhodospirillales bacterium]